MEKNIPRNRNRGSWGLGILNGRAAEKMHLNDDLWENRYEPHQMRGSLPGRGKPGQSPGGSVPSFLGTARRPRWPNKGQGCALGVEREMAVFVHDEADTASL